MLELINEILDLAVRYLTEPVNLNEFMDGLHVALEFAEKGG